MTLAHRKHMQAGFTLFQMSIILTVAGIILVSVLPGVELGSTAEKDRVTKDRMEKIEQATRNFMAANLRRPCPADNTLDPQAANFGVEAAAAGNCTSGTPAANFTETSPITLTGNSTQFRGALTITSATGTAGLRIGMLVYSSAAGIGVLNQRLVHIISIDSATQITLDSAPAYTASGASLTFTSVVGGGVPTKTLGLTDEYGLDGYGRRMNYVVDIGATNDWVCRNMQHNGIPGGVTIKDGVTGNITDSAMWALISYGKDGHGAFPIQGGALSTRFNTGNTDNDTAVNAFFNTASIGTSTFSNMLIRKPKTATFDDLVWTDSVSKNQCCIGKQCMAAPYATNTFPPLNNNSAESTMVVGDFNGDGTPDLYFNRVIGGTAFTYFYNGARNLFSQIDSTFTDRIYALAPVGAANMGGSNSSPMLGKVGAGDIDGDGKDDLAIGWANSGVYGVKIIPGTAQYYFHSNSIAAGFFSDFTNNITTPATDDSDAPSIAVGDFNGDGLKDIFIRVSQTEAYMIFGRTGSATPTPAATTSTAPLTFDLTAPTSSPICLGGATAVRGFKITASTLKIDAVNTAGDLNGDGIDDIIISGYTNGTPQSYILFGRASWSGDVTECVAATSHAVMSLDGQAGQAGKFTTISGDANIGRYSTRVADISGPAFKQDGINDLIINNGTRINVVYGQNPTWPATINLASASCGTNCDGTNGFYFDVGTSAPTGINVATSGYPVFVGDLNNDGLNDMVFVAPNTSTNSGTSFIAFQPAAGWNSIATSGGIRLFGGIFSAGGFSTNGFKASRIDGPGSYTVVQAIVDLNNDGLPDLVLSPSTSPSTQFYVLPGRKNVPWEAITKLQ